MNVLDLEASYGVSRRIRQQDSVCRKREPKMLCQACPVSRRATRIIVQSLELLAIRTELHATTLSVRAVNDLADLRTAGGAEGNLLCAIAERHNDSVDRYSTKRLEPCQPSALRSLVRRRQQRNAHRAKTMTCGEAR
jgi:hypothetical protein